MTAGLLRDKLGRTKKVGTSEPAELASWEAGGPGLRAMRVQSLLLEADDSASPWRTALDVASRQSRIDNREAYYGNGSLASGSLGWGLPDATFVYEASGRGV